MRKFKVLFLCWSEEECPTCERVWPDKCCRGHRFIEVTIPQKLPTMGELREAALNPACPVCGGQMYINSVQEI